MKIQKYAKINLILQLLQLFVVCQDQTKNIIDISQAESCDSISYSNNLLKKDLIDLKKKKLVEQNQIIIDVISGINPMQITSSCDCLPKITQLKQLQDSLLEKDYKIKIIL